MLSILELPIKSHYKRNFCYALRDGGNYTPSYINFLFKRKHIKLQLRNINKMVKYLVVLFGRCVSNTRLIVQDGLYLPDTLHE